MEYLLLDTILHLKWVPNTLLMSALFLWITNWLLGPWNFFDNQAGHWFPACMTVRVSISITVSNVDTNTDFSFVNVVAVAFYCSGLVIRLAAASHPPNDVNGHWTAALGAVEADEPSLAAVAAIQIKVSLVNHTENSTIFLLVENAILQKKIQRKHL